MRVTFKCKCGYSNNTKVTSTVRVRANYIVVEATCSNCLTPFKDKAYKDPRDYGDVAIYSERDSNG